MCDGGEGLMVGILVKEDMGVVGCQHVLPPVAFHNGSGIDVHNGSHIGDVGYGFEVSRSFRSFDWCAGWCRWSQSMGSLSPRVFPCPVNTRREWFVGGLFALSISV